MDSTASDRPSVAKNSYRGPLSLARTAAVADLTQKLQKAGDYLMREIEGDVAVHGAQRRDGSHQNSTDTTTLLRVPIHRKTDRATKRDARCLPRFLQREAGPLRCIDLQYGRKDKILRWCAYSWGDSETDQATKMPDVFHAFCCQRISELGSSGPQSLAHRTFRASCIERQILFGA